VASDSQYSAIDPGTKLARYQQLLGSLKSERSSFDSQWREIGEFVVPRRTRFFASDRNRGDKRSGSIIDSTGRFAARTLQSGMHAGLTSPARPWMKLTTPDPDLALQGNVKAWLHQATQRMLTIFATSNLYNVLPTVYGDMGTFATAAMALLDDSKDLFRAYAYPIGSYVVGQDARGLATTFMREYQLTVRQIVEQFALSSNGQIDWTTVSSRTRALWDTAAYEQAIDVCWAVMPNEDADSRSPLARHFKWKSCYWEVGTSENKFLRESGFLEFPLMIPRWDVTAEDSYGVDCPGMIALGDIKQLQSMQKEKGKAIQKIVNPPLTGPTALMTQKTSLLPGDVTYVDTREGMSGLRSIHEINLNLQHLVMNEQQVQGRIQRAFYEDLFLMLAQQDNAQPITAREVEERHEEKLLALGPVLERTNDELLDPLVDRCFQMMLRAGLLPESPEELHGIELKVEYTSILAQAQKLVAVGGMDRLLSTVIPIAEQRPDVWAKLDLNAIVDGYADALGVDPRFIRSNDDAQALVDAANKQAAAAQSVDTALKGAQAAKAAAAAPLDGNTLLSRTIGNVSGAGAGGAALAGG
jgi:hypothetical protein